MRHTRWPGMVAGVCAASLLVAGCSTSGDGDGAEGGASATPGQMQELTLWTHSAGNPKELAVVEKQIADFNASQDRYKVVFDAFPQASYNDSVVAAAAAGDLPCLLDMDGPIVPNWAWAGYVTPIQIDEAKLSEWLPSATGSYKGELYAIGYWDAALGVYARQSVLDKFTIRIPTVDQPWTADEFNAALKTLKDSGEFDYALEVGTGNTGEWFPYAFSPFLQSFGGDLINRDTMLTAEGVLNGPEAVAWGTWWQSLFKDGYANQLDSEGREAFNEGTTALSWNGNWAAVDALKANDDVLFLPPPDFGNAPVIGGQSWMYGVSSNCEYKEGAMEYLNFSLDDKYLVEYSDVIGLIPTTATAREMTENYKVGGVLEPFTQFSEKFAVIRPPTPAYSVIALTFEKAAQNIMNGADVQSELDQAVKEIDSDIESNQGYGF